MQAAILSVKLQYLDKWNQQRRRVADYYFKNLKTDKIILPRERENIKHVYHLFVIQAENRDRLIEYLKANNISAGIHYPISLPHQKAYSYLGHKLGDFPISEKLSADILSLPMYPELSEDQLKYIVSKVETFYS